MWLISEELVAVAIPLDGKMTTHFAAENDAAAVHTNILSRTILSAFNLCSHMSGERNAALSHPRDPVEIYIVGRWSFFPSFVSNESHKLGANNRTVTTILQYQFDPL